MDHPPARTGRSGCCRQGRRRVLGPVGERSFIWQSINPGDRCQVWLAKEQREFLPGFYLATGNAESPVAEEVPSTRALYWHLKSDAAVPFIGIATSLLNESQIPFRAKVLSDPKVYHRADAGVIYFRRRDDSRHRPDRRDIYSDIAPRLRAEVPLFSRRLGDGLGLAESPGSNTSFGEHRCQLVAQALWDSFLRCEVDRSSRLATLASKFQREGLDPLKPHLGPDSSDHDFGPQFSQAVASAQNYFTDGLSEGSRIPTSATASSSSMLDAAAEIGLTLSRTAFWSKDGRFCNWIGRTNNELAHTDRVITPTASALGPTLYAGTAGIALFLSQLHARTGDAEFGRLASASIAHSIREFERSVLKEPISPLSFFSGDLGAAFVARCIGIQSGDAELLTRSASMVDRVVESAVKPHMLDVIGGNAGAIPVLLALSREPGHLRCRELAISLGEELAQHDPYQSGVSGKGWQRQPGLELDSHTPSGLSHGASGIGLALLELYAATGRVDFRDAARRSFEYEDTLFDPRESNWADLRRPSGRACFDRFWCNGAPGIALAQLRP